MPRWTVTASNGNGQFVVVAEQGKSLTLAIEARYSDEPTEFDPAAVEDIRSKLAFAVGVARGGDPS